MITQFCLRNEQIAVMKLGVFCLSQGKGWKALAAHVYQTFL